MARPVSKQSTLTTVVMIAVLVLGWWWTSRNSSDPEPKADVGTTIEAVDRTTDDDVPTAAGAAGATTAADTDVTTVAGTDRAPDTIGGAASGPAPAGADVPAGFDTIAVADLPDEAIDTLALIEQGGPFPYRQDGGVFQNREGILPDRPPGHYSEFTVDTPGSDDRGARRIITGGDGEMFYTDDHYDSFRVIVA